MLDSAVRPERRQRRAETLPDAVLFVTRRSPFRLLQGEAVHGVQQFARHLRHLLGRGRQFGRTRSGLLHQFAHALHGLDHRLRAGGLLFDRGVDLVRDFVQARGGARDLRRAVRLLVGGRADFLRELVNLGDHVGDLAQGSVQFLPRSSPSFTMPVLRSMFSTALRASF